MGLKKTVFASGFVWLLMGTCGELKPTWLLMGTCGELKPTRLLMGTCGELKPTRRWTFGFYEDRGISSVVEETYFFKKDSAS
jgi:hypothetical protein